MSEQTTITDSGQRLVVGAGKDNDTKNNVRDRYVDKQASLFSEWHRNELPGWYTWTDIDYVGYQGEEVYIIIDYVNVPGGKFKNAPAEYPLWDHQEPIYTALANAMSCPAYIVWHTDSLDRFAAERIDIESDVEWIYGKHEFADFLDQHRK